MAERVVQVTIRAAVDKYVTGMERARKATAAAASEADKLERVGQAAEKVGGAVTTMGAASVAAVGYMVKVAADFDAQMSKVQAATGATAAEMDKFRNQALTAGAAFGYTANQVTEAQIELGKAGIAAKDILGGGLSGVLALAASDNVELGKATQIAAVAMKQFNLQGQDIPHIADLLAAGAGKALGGVEQLGDALNQSGLVASNFGFSIEETTGVLSAFADAGLLGSDAGTSLKSMLQMLANPSKESAQLMKDLGINVEDTNGQFLGAANIAQVLHDKLGTLSDAQRQQALSQIFGADAVRAATVLYKEGADGIQDYINQNNDAGYAIDQAAKKSNNLNGDLKKLRSAFQSGLIDTGTSASSALRPLVQNVTQFVQAVNEMPEPLKAAALGTTAVVGGVSLLGGGLLLAIPKIVEFRAALATLEASGISGRAALNSVSGFLAGPWGGGITIGVAALALLNTELEKLKADSSEVTHVLQSAKNVQEIYDTLGKGMIWSPGTASITDQLKDLDSALQAFASHNSSDGFQAILTRFTNTNYNQGVNALRDINEEMGQLAATDPTKAVRAFQLLAEQTDGSQKNLHRLVDAIGGDYRSALVSQADALGIVANDTNLVKLAMGQYADAAKGAKDPTQDNADALHALEEAAGQAAPSIDDVSNALKGLTSPTLDARAAQRELEAAIDAVSASVKDNGQSLDVTTEKGRANEAALDAIAQAAQNNAAALLQQTGSQDQATAAMESGRASLVAALGQYGITGQAAQDYADKIIGTPTQWATTFGNNAAAAGEPVSEYQKKLDALPAEKRTQVNAAVESARQGIQSVIDTLSNLNSKTISITTINRRVEQAVAAGAAPGAAKAAYATGGRVRGPGTGTSDSVPAYLSNGEYVIRERSVRKYGTGLLDRINAGHYANGGLVETRTRQNTLAKNRFKNAQTAQRKAQSAFNKAKTAANRARLLAAQAETRTARIVAQRAADALQKAKDAPTGADLGDRISFRSAVRDGSYDTQAGVRDLYAMGQDTGKYSARQRTSFLTMANKNELAMLKLEKQSTAAAKAVEAASDKLGDLKSASASMTSGISGRLSGIEYGSIRSGSSLTRVLTSRAGKLKQFQGLLSTLQKNGIAPALLNEIASLGVDEGFPLARSLATMSKGQLAAIGKQYGAVQSTATAIGNQVAGANYNKLIEAAEKQLSNADKNADKISKQIADQSKALQKVIGRALGLPGYSAGGYTGDGDASSVAGLVHRREFVVNRYATAQNRPLLEAMNQGANVRYMDASRVVPAAPAAGLSAPIQQVTVQPMQHVDPTTMTTVMARELSRQFAGMVS